MTYGDLATWVGSIGVVGTLYLALVQIRAEQRQRRADQRAALQRERRQQAERISGWPGRDITETTTLVLLNRSDEPVYEVIATLVFVQGGGARCGEDYRSGNFRPLSVISVLPPGRWRVDVHGNWHGMNRRPGVEVAFIDRAGITWIRRATGALEEVEQPPIDHYGLGRPQSMGMPESDEVLPVRRARSGPGLRSGLRRQAARSAPSFGAHLDPSLVRHVHVVGHRRWPGLLPLPRSPRVGQIRMSLWSAFVVSIRGAASGEHLIRGRRGSDRSTLVTWASCQGFSSRAVCAVRYIPAAR